MINRKQNSEVGVVLGLILLVMGLVSGNLWWNKWAAGILLITVLIPVVYTPLSWLWFGFARLAERFFSTVLLTLVFYLLVTPVAWLRRGFCDDTLSLRAFKKGENSVFVIKNKTYNAKDLEQQY